jgi:hypothetical protein
MTVHLALLLSLDLSSRFGLLPPMPVVITAVSLAGRALACVMALLLTLAIAKEHEDTFWLYVAWQALSAHLVIALLRMFSQTSLLSFILPSYSGGELRGLHDQLLLVFSNLTLLLCVVPMCWVYHRIGLGLRVERRDYAWFAVMVAVLLGLSFLKEHLSLANSSYPAARTLQQFNFIPLMGFAVISLLLHRQAQLMGGGRLALALRTLTVYAVLRCLVVLIGALQRAYLPDGDATLSIAVQDFLLLGGNIIPWLVTLAATYRVELTAIAARKLAERRALNETYLPHSL